jgi:hypothetical protein
MTPANSILLKSNTELRSKEITWNGGVHLKAHCLNSATDQNACPQRESMITTDPRRIKIISGICEGVANEQGA